MRVEKHVFTAGMTTSKKGAKVPSLLETFQKGAPINMTSRPLSERVTKAKKVTKRGEDLSKQVRKIVGKIPTPFLINPKRSSSSGS
jgi:hypothetical protein